MASGARQATPSSPLTFRQVVHPDERQRRVVNWQGFEHACIAIARYVTDSGFKPEAILGIPRGGLNLAVRLSHLLTVPMTDNPNYCVAPCLIVDDLIDTGYTVTRVLRSMPKLRNYRIVCWHLRDGADIQPHFHVESALNDNIIYPWKIPANRLNNDG